MNRRDSTLIAHLDAIDARWTQHLTLILTELRLIREDIAGLKVDMATHGHGGDE